jgi:hypothetical protein
MSATRTHPTSAHGLTIGVFDSGFGGLTVLRELPMAQSRRQRLPGMPWRARGFWNPMARSIW